MKRIILSALCAVPAFCMGQTLLYNDGAMVKVQAGATLYVEGGIHNTATGTIDNDGTIELKGNFLNQGTWLPDDPNTLILSGNVDSDITSGTAVFQTVSIEKDDNSHVNILDDMQIDDNLDFNAAGTSKIYTSNFLLTIGTTGTVTGYDDDEYVVTDGTGMMEKKVDADGSFFFPVGDDSNYSPLESTYTGSAYADADIRTKVHDLVHPENPADVTEYITRYWDVEASNITDYENEMTGTYVAGDIELDAGDAGDIKGAVYDGADWLYAGADAGTNTVTGSTEVEDAEFTGTNFFGHPDIAAYLQGPYNIGLGEMTINLNTGGLIPLDSPYPDAPATVGSIPADVTDWVKLELRDPALPGVAVGKASAFIKKDGSIVGLDGTSLPRIKNGHPTSVVALYHRNHLPIRTPDAGIDVVNPTLHDFSTGLGQAHDNPAFANDAMIDMSGGVYGLFRGNANGDNSINVLDFALEKNNSNPSQFNVYSKYDINMDKNVNVLDLALVKNASNPSKTAHIQ